jgi:prophage regulatory protein
MNMHTFERMPDAAYIRLPQVLELFPVSKSTWWEGVATGKYPAGHKLSAHITAWKLGDIRKLLNGAWERCCEEKSDACAGK